MKHDLPEETKQPFNAFSTQKTEMAPNFWLMDSAQKFPIPFHKQMIIFCTYMSNIFFIYIFSINWLVRKIVTKISLLFSKAQDDIIKL